MTERIYAANWKMHKTKDEVGPFFREFVRDLPSLDGCRLIFFPPSVLIAATVGAIQEVGLEAQVGGQNIHWEGEGPFTGEVSARMLRAEGATHCLIGHSERRHCFGEDDETVRMKLVRSVAEGLVPVLCVGERLEEREAGRTEMVVIGQVEAALRAEVALDPDGFLVAYEPVWAIGTGRVAHPQDAAAVHSLIRSNITNRFGEEAAGRVPILYGGSVNPENISALMAESEIDGVLVGGASLNPESFREIVISGGLLDTR